MQKKWNISGRFSGHLFPNVMFLTYFCKNFVYNRKLLQFLASGGAHYI